MKTVYRKWIGERLKFFRIQNKLTPAQVSEAIEMHVKTYSHYEEGVSMPSVVTLKSICQKYLISLDYFMDGSPGKEISQFESSIK